MAELLKGAPVAEAILKQVREDTGALKQNNVVPTLAVFRVGERAEDISYEKSAMKRCEQAGIAVKQTILPADTDSETFFRTLQALNEDKSVHGILLFRPLPAHLDGEQARQMLRPEKDVDGCTDGSLAGVFTNQAQGFPPCTAQAVMEILHHYGVNPAGMKTAVIGRSLVIGRPVAMMLMHEQATVCICHTRTQDVSSITRSADLVIAASGQMESIGAAYLSEGQIVIDVGINWNEEKQKMCGDVRFEEAEALVKAITPVPGGVGGVTSAVLCKHVAKAAKRSISCSAFQSAPDVLYSSGKKNETNQV